MKKITVFLGLVFAFAQTYAQDYQIIFAGTGASTSVDSVKVENLTQCTDTTLGGNDTLCLINIGINESDVNPAVDKNMHIHPNPMTDNCSVDFEATAPGKTTLNLYDITGKRILQTKDFLSKGHHTYNLSGLSSGIYLLKVKSECEAYSYMTKIVSNNLTRSSQTEIKYIGITTNVNKQNTASNTTKTKSAKSGKSIIKMQYTTGDRLKITGKSGIYRTVFMLIPTQSQIVTFNFIDCTDADSNHYAVVQIGTQVWMAENLKTTKYRNSSNITNIFDGTQWGALTTGAYCNYNNDTAEGDTYGRLYNWYAVADSHNICPVGWHAPSDSEWWVLNEYLGVNAGGKMKENCTTLWYSPNDGATNESGFSALPGGYRGYGSGGFYDMRLSNRWWSAYDTSSAWCRGVYFNTASLSRYDYYLYKVMGFSVRCVRD